MHALDLEYINLYFTRFNTVAGLELKVQAIVKPNTGRVQINIIIPAVVIKVIVPAFSTKHMGENATLSLHFTTPVQFAVYI